MHAHKYKSFCADNLKKKNVLWNTSSFLFPSNSTHHSLGQSHPNDDVDISDIIHTINNKKKNQRKEL